jgi:hypothetical protein
MESTRKKAAPTEVTVRKAKNGGYIVRHSFDNNGMGESYRSPEEHAFTSHADMLKHVATHTSGAPPTEKNGSAPAGVGRVSATKPPGPRSKGAGLD